MASEDIPNLSFFWDDGHRADVSRPTVFGVWKIDWRSSGGAVLQSPDGSISVHQSSVEARIAARKQLARLLSARAEQSPDGDAAPQDEEPASPELAPPVTPLSAVNPGLGAGLGEEELHLKWLLSQFDWRLDGSNALDIRAVTDNGVFSVRDLGKFFAALYPNGKSSIHHSLEAAVRAVKEEHDLIAESKRRADDERSRDPQWTAEQLSDIQRGNVVMSCQHDAAADQPAPPAPNTLSGADRVAFAEQVKEDMLAEHPPKALHHRIAIIGKETIAMLRAGAKVELDCDVTLIPASDLSHCHGKPVLDLPHHRLKPLLFKIINSAPNGDLSTVAFVEAKAFTSYGAFSVRRHEDHAELNFAARGPSDEVGTEVLFATLDEAFDYLRKKYAEEVDRDFAKWAEIFEPIGGEA